MDDETTVLTLVFDHKVNYRCFLLSDPDRLAIDFENCQLKGANLFVTNNTLIKKVRRHVSEDENLRLVFDLKQKIHYRASENSLEHKVIIKLASQEGSGPSKKEKSSESNNRDLLSSILEEIEQEKKEHPELVKKNLISLQSSPNLIGNVTKKVTVVIDPGHGGKDPGATGIHGTVEKDVVLQISKKLQAMLNEEPGLHAVLTRTTDNYIPLRKRLSIARKNHADLFVAVHADAYHHCQAMGASVYALSQRGATSEAAHWLAEKENESELGGLGSELADKDAILRSVLIDLSQTHTIESSLQVGNYVLTHLGKMARLHHSRIEQAAFVVLKSPDIPSILVETGFLSNSTEETKLRDQAYQQRTAYCIKEGIKQYFKANHQ